MTETTFAIEALRRCALFAQVDDQILALCASSLRIRRYRKNETIFHQGDPGDSLYIIESGSVKIVLPSPEGEEGAIIATLARADFFGELALLDGAPHSATAVAIEPTEALVLRRDRFEELVETEPELRKALFAALVDRAPPAHRPRRGAPLPGPARPPGRAARPARAGRAEPDATGRGPAGPGRSPRATSPR